MLQAFKHHKISKTIRDELWNQEDVKTSSIIGTLSYLPTEMFWGILKRSIRNNDENLRDSGDLLQIDFWAQWKLGKDRIEPDVFIRFEHFDVIIELKRNDGNKQTSWQWKNELGAYHQKYGNSKKVYLIAISGRTYDSHKDVFQCSWTLLRDEVNNVYIQEQSKNPYSSEIRILRTALDAFDIHREYKFYYFEDILYNREKDKIGDYSSLFTTK